MTFKTQTFKTGLIPYTFILSKRRSNDMFLMYSRCKGNQLCNIILEVDECLEGTDNCDVNADCINTAGLFACECHQGYNNSGNGREGECHGK